MKWKYPVYQPEITSLEKKYVNECLDSSWISSKGRFVQRFEDLVSEFCGVKHCIPVFNGTVALHLALLPLKLQPQDEVIVCDFSYIATSNAVKYVGAKVRYVDADDQSWNMSLPSISRSANENTKAIICTDIYGMPHHDYDELQEFCKNRNITLIADAAESFGSEYKGKKCGSLAQISTFSFFGNKTITTGEGGMVLTSNDDYAQQIRQLKNQGNSTDRRYYHDILGYNYRMTNIQCAIGCAQIERIKYIIDRKKEIHEMYRKSLGDYVQFQEESEHVTSNYWMNGCLVENNIIMAHVTRGMALDGIESRPFFPQMSSMPFNEYASNPTAEDLSKRGIIFPSYPGLKDNDVSYIIESFKKHLQTP